MPKTMTVAELIASLQNEDPTSLVMIKQPTHNYWRQTAAVPVEVEQGYIKYSDYLSSYETYESDDECEEAHEVILLG